MKNTLILILCLTSCLCFSQTDSDNHVNSSKYLLHGKLTAKDGHAEELANILIEASGLVSTAKGCKLYVVSKDKSEPNSIYITEIWESKEDHDNSLKDEKVRALITRAMPIIKGQPEIGQELQFLGGTKL